MDIWAQKDENGERGLHNEELHSLYRLSNIVSAIKSRRWADVAEMEEGKSDFNFFKS